MNTLPQKNKERQDFFPLSIPSLFIQFRMYKISTWQVLILYIFFLPSNNVSLQTYYAFGNLQYWRIDFDNALCDGCSIEPQGYTTEYGSGLSFCPDGSFYVMNGPFLLEFDLNTGSSALVAEWPLSSNPQMAGIVCISDSVFYTIQYFSGNLFIWNINSGIVTDLGSTGINPFDDMSIVEGKYYGASEFGIVHIDITNPSNSSLVVANSIPPYRFTNPTASPFCNTLIATGRNVSGDPELLVSINLVDGAITPLCYSVGDIPNFCTFLEHIPPEHCDNSLDLDCDNSSGASGSDFSSNIVSCLSQHAYIADEDVRMYYNDIISEVIIRVTGFVPDGIQEYLMISGGVAGISVAGSGTDMITLSNAGGARSTEFIDALRLIQYRNDALYPTGGQRTVEVQFTTASGSMSNVATAFIEVIELPQLQVDLGPDIDACEGESYILDAGHPGATYQWSSGQTTRMITPADPGTYIVIVSNGLQCPGSDTILYDVLPVIEMALTGPSMICDNQAVMLTLTTDAPFPVTVEIQSTQSGSILLQDVMGTVQFQDIISFASTYTISAVTPSSPACIELAEDQVTVEVFPTYVHQVEVSMCEGDSVWLGFHWEKFDGTYENFFSSIHGCDSTVTTTIYLLPAELIFLQDETCDPTQAGVFFQHLDNPNGCDTVIRTTVTLLPSDTTTFIALTCSSSQVGSTIDTLINALGCDSLILHAMVLDPPADTTMVIMNSCDSLLLGTVYNTLMGADGCDSIVAVVTSFAEVDTTYISGTSCIPQNIGVFEDLYASSQGCDSLVITTITPGLPDTTYLNLTSCDSSTLGVTEEIFVGVNGCDSLIITTVTYSESDSTFLDTVTCDPAEAGIYIVLYLNQFGCDSIVTSTITLAPTHDIQFVSTSCQPQDTGTFVQYLTNQSGCDSIVTTVISLLPAHDVFFMSSSCHEADTGVFIQQLINQHGCDSIVTSIVSLTDVITTILEDFTCDENSTGSVETLYTSTTGCDSLVIELTSLFPLTELELQSTMDYNGYDVSCAGADDGGIEAIADGNGPFAYLWSTGDMNSSIQGVQTGSYSVGVTDGNGCIITGVITLHEPEEFMLGFGISSPGCFEQEKGSITVMASGGVPPYRYAMNGSAYTTDPTFDGLDGGLYHLTALDANECEAGELIWIKPPVQVQVDLGGDQHIASGDTVRLEAMVNVPLDSLSLVTWNGAGTAPCVNCITQTVVPVITTSYSVEVISVDGCSDRDDMTVYVDRDDEIYVPNIFSPNGDGINDRLVIGAGRDIEMIHSLVIFDRWGTMVYSANEFAPNDASVAWDGTSRGQMLNPGVFTYRVEVRSAGGGGFVRYGDVTLVR